ESLIRSSRLRVSSSIIINNSRKAAKRITLPSTQLRVLKYDRMKFRSVMVAIMLLAGCATLQPQQTRAVSDTPAVSGTPTPKSQIKNRDRDLYECERESAFASAGDKRKAFDSCMKARGY